MGFSGQEYWSVVPLPSSVNNLDSILKSRDITLPRKICLVKTVVFPVVMYGCELDYKESWALKNWCFWTVVLEKTLESPLDCKQIQPVHPKGDQSWVFIGRTHVEAETPLLWPRDEKGCLIWKDPDAGKDWGQEEKGRTEDEMVGLHHQLNGHGFGWTLWAGDGQGGLSVLQFMGLQRVRHDWVTELNWLLLSSCNIHISILVFQNKYKCQKLYISVQWKLMSYTDMPHFMRGKVI